MGLITFQVAGKESRGDLVELLELCFNEGDGINQSFVDFGIENHCLTLKKDGKIISALYLLDSYIVDGNELRSAYYVYAVGTHPDFRGKGSMSLLLNLADDFAKENKREYMLLVPSNEKNRSFYKKNGYEDFFKVRYVEVDGRRYFSNFKENKNISDYNDHVSYKKIAKIRRKFFSNTGNVMWGDNHIKFAKDFVKVCSGNFFCTENGYVVCYENKENIEIREIAVPDEEFQQLLEKIFSRVTAEKYIFRLPVESNIFKGQGIVSDFAMIKPISRTTKKIRAYAPYLGLPLD